MAIQSGKPTVIFDFGGVLYEIDFHNCVTTFKNMGVPDFDKHYSKATQSGLFQDFEKGLLSSNQFVDKLNEKIDLRLDKEKVKTAWNSLLVGYLDENLSVLTEIKNDFNLILLSNTNEIHHSQFSAELKDLYDANFEDLFDEVLFSHKVNMRKPDIEIYDRAKSNIPNNSRVVFIDDSIQNVESAERAGITSFHFAQNQSLKDQLPGILAKLNE
jgi:putative hydrolase of the HAD superfamily